MPRIDLSKDESIDKALKVFKMKMRREGIIDEIKKREFYEKPSQKRRKDHAKAIKREQRRNQQED